MPYKNGDYRNEEGFLRSMTGLFIDLIHGVWDFLAPWEPPEDEDDNEEDEE